jgi:hypothetical protein
LLWINKFIHEPISLKEKNEAGYLVPGLPDFSWCNIPKGGKYIPKNTKYTKWQQSLPNGHQIGRPYGHKIYQHLRLQDPPKFTQIGIFGLKI